MICWLKYRRYLIPVLLQLKTPITARLWSIPAIMKKFRSYEKFKYMIWENMSEFHDFSVFPKSKCCFQNKIREKFSKK